MIRNFYFVTIVIGNESFDYLYSYFYFVFISVVIICIAALHLYHKHQKVTGVVNYVVLSLVNFNLDQLILYRCFFLNNSLFNISNVVCSSS